MSAPIILFDFDGVLAETRAPRIAALRAGLAAEGFEIPEGMLDEAGAGLSFAAAARTAIRLATDGGDPPDDTAVDLAALRAGRAFRESAARGLPLSPGAAAFVRGAAGIARLGIVTRARRRDVDLVLSFSGLADHFECIVAEEDYAGPEPARDPYDAAIGRMSRGRPQAAGRAIPLVASLAAVASARAAGLRPIVVGAVSPALAFAGDGYLASLETATVADVSRLASGAVAR